MDGWLVTGNGIDISAFGEPRRDLYEAALWTVRLQDRTPRGDGAVEHLLGGKAASDDAYAKVKQVWQDLAEPEAYRPRPRVDAPAEFPRRPRAGLQALAWMPSAIAAMLVLFVGAALFLSAGQRGYQTDIGEQRVVELADGTKVTLNTDTKVSVDFTEERRGFRVYRGEALFEVTHDASRPFVVEAADSHVRALGTSFIVRRDKDRVDVTLLSGSVEVTRDSEQTKKVALVPGERLRLHEDMATTALDRPPLPVVTAWKNGRLILQETPVIEALREINRYNQQKVLVAGGISDDDRISGVFRVTDARAFADTLAEIYRLKIQESPDQLLLRPRLALR